MSFKRRWKTTDLVGLFNDHAKGRQFFRCHTNHDIESFGDFFSVKLDPGWPYGIPDAERDVTMKYEIESNIAVPSIHRRDGLKNSMMETMSELEPSQSFLVPLEGKDDRIGRLATAFASAKQAFDGKKMFVSRKENNPDGTPKGLRIWRVS